MSKWGDDWKGLGISYIWGLPETHPFHPAGVWHDEMYDLQEAGQLGRSRKDVDLEFYGRMLSIAGNNRWMRFKAFTFYTIARTFGGLVW